MIDGMRCRVLWDDELRDARGKPVAEPSDDFDTEEEALRKAFLAIRRFMEHRHVEREILRSFDQVEKVCTAIVELEAIR